MGYIGRWVLIVANEIRHPGSFGIRRPSRAVSLGDVRQQPVQRMGGGVFNWGGYGNPPEIWTRGPTGSSWNITSNAEAQRFLEAAAEQMRRDDRDDAPPPDAPLEEIIDPVYGYLGRSPRYIALPEGGGIDDNAPEPGEGEAVDPVRDPQPVYEPEPDTGPMLMAGAGQESLPAMSPEEIAREAQRKINREGLAGARRALEQGPSRVPDHLDDFVPDEDYGGVLEARREPSPLGWLGGRAAEREGRQTYEPGPSKRAYPGAPLTPREPVGGLHPSEVRRESLADRLREALAGYNPGRSYNGAPSLDAVGRAATSMLTSAGSTGHLGGPGQPFGSDPYRAPRGSRRDPGNPQSQMSQQFLADRFAQQAAQPQQGYFGGLGEAVGGMSTEQKIALLVGLGLLTGGTSTPLMAPALGVGAGLAFTQ